jgi:hypothetical protein
MLKKINKNAVIILYKRRIPTYHIQLKADRRLLRKVPVCDHKFQSVTSFCRDKTAPKSRQGAGLIVDAQTLNRNLSLPIGEVPNMHCDTGLRAEIQAMVCHVIAKNLIILFPNILPTTANYLSWIPASTEIGNCSKRVPNHTR